MMKQGTIALISILLCFNQIKYFCSTESVEVDLEAGTKTLPPMPKLVTVTISKPSRDALVGLGVVDRPGNYGTTVPVINSMKEGSLCSGTALEEGMHLYRINGVTCKGKDDATAMMKVSEGSIVVVAGPPGLVWATVVKPTKETRVGLHVERYKSSPKVIVGSVKGLFAETPLKEGMTILQINENDVTPMAMNQVLDLVAEAEGKVTVLAQAPQDISAKPMGHPPPEGLGGGEWGSTTFVGPQTAALAIAAIPTVIGWAIILLFLPTDKTDVYRLGDKLYTPNGEFYKSATTRNFEIRKSEHMTEKVPGMWGTTTYVGPLTWSLAICSIWTVVGACLVLLFLPMDERDVYYSQGKLYTPNGFFYKSATPKNFKLRKSGHLMG